MNQGQQVLTQPLRDGLYMTLRCFEQIKVALGKMELSATFIGHGIGLGYTNAGPTHYVTEDISCMPAICGCEVAFCSDSTSVIETARLTQFLR